jgi:hypothetical protein
MNSKNRSYQKYRHSGFTHKSSKTFLVLCFLSWAMTAVSVQSQMEVPVKARLPPPPPRLGDKDVVLSGEFNHMDFSFEDFVKNDLRVRLDTGE